MNSRFLPLSVLVGLTMGCSSVSAAETAELILQTGHQAYAAVFAFRPDGQQLLTGSWDTSAILWDRAHGHLIRQLFGHSQSISAVDFSRDGRLALTASRDKTAILWDPVTGAQVHVFQGHTLPIVTADLSDDGRLLVTGANDAEEKWKYKYEALPRITSEIFVWDAATGQRIRELKGDGAPVRAVAISPDGKYIVAGGGLAFRTEKQDLMERYEPRAEIAYKHFPEVVMWESQSGRRVQEFVGHTGEVSCVTFSPDSEKLLTAALREDEKWGRRELTSGRSADAFHNVMKTELFLWDLNTGGRIRAFEGHAFPIRSVQFSADGQRILTSASEMAQGTNMPKTSLPSSGLVVGTEKAPEVILWDTQTGLAVKSFRDHREVGAPALLAPDGRQIVTGPGVAPTLWDATTLSRIRTFGAHPVYGVKQAFFGRGTDQILTVTRDGVALLWDMMSGKPARVFPGVIESAGVSADGARVALGRNLRKGEAAQISIVDAETGQTDWEFKSSLEGPFRTPFQMFWSPDHRRAALVFARYPDEDSPYSEGATIVDLGNSKILTQCIGPPRFPNYREGLEIAAFSSRSDRLAGGYTDGRVSLWIPDSGQHVATFEAHASAITSLVFDPAGQRLATGSARGAVVLWDSTKRTMLRELKGHTGAIHGITFSRDGRLVATASEDKSAILWEAATGRPLHTFRGHTLGVRSVCLSSDSTRLLTASQDGTTRVWDAATGRELWRLVSFNQGQSWILVTREGYFDGTLDGQRLITWRVQDQVFPLELYEKQFHRPDLVSRILRGLPIEPQAVLPGARTPPLVRVEIETQDAKEAVVKVSATPGGVGATIAEVRVLIGGRDLRPEQRRSIVREPLAGPVAVFRAAVDFPPGRKEAVVAALASDELGLQSEPEFVTIRREGEIPSETRKLHVLAVGVSKYKFSDYDLQFADADAQALVDNLSRQKGAAFAEVESRLIVNSDATLPNIRAGLEWLRASCKPQDVAVVLFSGHGIRGQGGLYYVTHEGDLDELKETCLSWRELSNQLQQVQAWQILFLADCCHAGAFGERVASQDELAAALVKEAGVMVFASSRGREKSIESGEWQHGAFTRAILDGLEGQADGLPKDGQITISELQAFVTAHVTHLTENRQHPHIPRLENFDPGLVIGHVK